MIKAKIIGLLLITILFNINLFSQTSTAKNQNRNTFFPTELGNKKWKPLISLDARRSFFKERPVKINGFKLGVQYLGVHRMGIGFYNLDRNVDLPIFKLINQVQRTLQELYLIQDLGPYFTSASSIRPKTGNLLYLQNSFLEI